MLFILWLGIFEISLSIFMVLEDESILVILWGNRYFYILLMGLGIGFIFLEGGL